MTKWQRANRKNKSYKLEPYNPQWAKDFKKLKSQVSFVFGDNLLAFEHIGSTSVPGMLAKAQIDVCAVVKDLTKVKPLYGKFIMLGYEAKGDYVGQKEEYFTYDNEEGERKFNIHTLQAGNPTIEGYLSFREYLKAFPVARNKYIAIKKDLRSKFGENDYNSYDFGKGDRIEGLKKEALAWYRNQSGFNSSL